MDLRDRIVYLKCTESNESDNFTIGKSYKVVDGVFISDNGCIYSRVENLRFFYPEHFKFEKVKSESSINNDYQIY